MLIRVLENIKDLKLTKENVNKARPVKMLLKKSRASPAQVTTANKRKSYVLPGQWVLYTYTSKKNKE